MMRMIAAIDSHHGIADNDGIPWELPTDQEFFVNQTRDGLILMGFDTYIEFDSPMHSRKNYIATSRTDTLRDGFIAVPDAAAFVQEHAGDRINNIGGAGLFGSTLAWADELVLTRIDGDFNCTKFFPAFDEQFTLASESEPVTENGSTFTFQTWHPHRES